MRNKKLLCSLLCLALLTGCASSVAGETDLPEASFTTTDFVTEPTTLPVTEPATQPSAEAETQPAQVTQPGYYVAESYKDEEIFLDEEYLLEARMYLLLGEDGTGHMSFLGDELQLSWNTSCLIIDGEETPYSLEDGTLIIQGGYTRFAFRYVGEQLPEAYCIPIPVGFFAVASVGRDGNVAFYPSVDPENGYIRIRKDRTGELFFEGQLREFTLDEEFLYLDGEPVMYQYMPVSSFSEDDEDMLAVVFYGDTVTSIIFRPAEDPENT